MALKKRNKPQTHTCTLSKEGQAVTLAVICMTLKHSLGAYLEEKMEEIDTWKRHMNVFKPIN